jgi:NADPH:quinone reductase-like Zn-dependent oxidoreductase
MYALRPALPTVIGNEAVGRVLDVGPGVQNVKLGDRVLAPLSSFTWRERMVVSADGLFALPSDADPRQLAMLTINPPTAALLLSEYVDLKPGEWVVQNAANSGVGRWVIAFAKTRGLKTVNIVRRPELVAELEAIGGDVVVVDSPDVSERIKAAVGQAELRLALDGVSGPATGVLAATLSPRGTLVSFAAMSLGPMSISPLDVIFKPVTMRGFFLGHPEFAAKLAPAVVQAAEMIASGRLHVPVAGTYPLSSIKEAIAHAQRGGKVLLDVAGSST